LLPATVCMTTSGGGGGDFLAAAAIAPSPTRQKTTPSATVLITWSAPLHEEGLSVPIKSVQNVAARCSINVLANVQIAAKGFYTSPIDDRLVVAKAAFGISKDSILGVMARTFNERVVSQTGTDPFLNDANLQNHAHGSAP
jgi:hypothetical protein